MSAGYAVAPIFLIRSAGVPFDAIEALGTPESIGLARNLATCRLELVEAKAALDVAYEAGERLVSTEASHALRVALRSNRAPVAIAGTEPAAVTRYTAAAKKVENTERDLDLQLEREVNGARSALVGWSRRVLPRYLVFASPGVRDSLLRELNRYPANPAEIPVRRNAGRKTEQTLLLYLQRVAAKNDTFSEFGPGAWGVVVQQGRPVSIKPETGTSARELFFERWLAHAIAEVLTADPEAFDELTPRLNPNGTLDNGRFLFLNTGATVSLTDSQLALLQRCDGATPVHLVGGDSEVIRELMAKGVLHCAAEVPAMDPHAFEVLVQDVSQWRNGPVKDQWLSRMRALVDLRTTFGRTQVPEQRIEILDRIRTELDQFGGAQKSAQRFLYAATNPIGEECLRESGFQIRHEMVDEVASGAALWVDLWRDSYAFVAGRVAAGLRRVFERAATGQAALPMPAFLQACEDAKLSLTGPGLVALAVMAFQEVKAAVRDRLSKHADQEEYELTVADCHIVRQKFDYARFDEYTYPSADLQLAAESVEAAADGHYDWVVSELHPPVALLHHGVYWSCPDTGTLNEAFVQSTGAKPNFHFGFFAADFTAHTAVRLFDALPTLSWFVAPQRGNPNWQTVQPADAEVFVQEETEDVCLRSVTSKRYLGSFARNWVIPLGFHPFLFTIGRHTPRLRCGRVIVQRQAWTITRQDLPGEYTGISRDLVMAIERLRRERNLPRFVYIRPTEQALRRSGVEGRDKDTKPVFIDLESYLFHEILYRWLAKAGELEVTEMLPDPAHLLWNEPDGRRTFELRTLIVPRS